jgi:hypothetical protein
MGSNEWTAQGLSQSFLRHFKALLGNQWKFGICGIIWVIGHGNNMGKYPDAEDFGNSQAGSSTTGRIGTVRYH